MDESLATTASEKNDARFGRELLEILKKDPADAKGLVRAIEVFHALEHVSDGAVAIAKRMQLIDEPPPSIAG